MREKDIFVIFTYVKYFMIAQLYRNVLILMPNTGLNYPRWICKPKEKAQRRMGKRTPCLCKS